MLVEQAIFTSARTDRSAGYQLVSRSPAVSGEDARLMSAWGPSHDSLWESGPDALSVNFHPLPSGAYCISRTTPAGGEYSGRGGYQVYTQCLLVPAEGLLRFGNNPFALLTAAFAQGSLRVYEKIPAELKPLRIAGKAAAVDQTLLLQLSAAPGAEWMGALVEAALANERIALVGGENRLRLIAGLFNCLPVECRTEFSFSTGLKFSPRRRFRVTCLPDDAAQHRRLARQYDLATLHLSGDPPRELISTTGWGGFVTRAIATENIAFLAENIALPFEGLQLSQLTSLGDMLAETMVCQNGASNPADRAHLQQPGSFDVGTSPQDESDRRRADAAHVRMQKTAAAATILDALPAADTDLYDAPSQQLANNCPEVIEQLELLDDTVFETIAGKHDALQRFKTLWPEVLAQLGPELLEESRQQYIQHALCVWNDCVEGDEIRNPDLALAVMDVLSVLLNR